MTQWLQTLSPLEYAMLLIAIPATLILILQTLLLLFGLHQDSDGDVDADVDADGDLDADFDADGDLDADFDGDLDGDFDGDPDAGGALELDDGPDADGDLDGPGRGGLFGGLRIFTLRGIVAFLAIFGWGSLWLLRLGLHPLFALFLGVAMGVWAMVLVALVLRAALRLQSDGTLHIQNALGLSGTAYLPIPPGRTGAGKVTVLVQERLTEFSAVTDDPQAIPTGAEVLVVAISGRDTLIVTRK